MKEGIETPMHRPITLADAMNRFFDDSAFDPFEGFSNMFPMLPSKFMSVAFPRVDISETEDEVKIVANIPGVDPEKIEIEVHDGILSLSGKVDREQEEKDKKYYRYEREYGEFRREFILPRKVMADKISAKAKNGVLTVTIPKAEEEKKKKVKVQAE